MKVNKMRFAFSMLLFIFVLPAASGTASSESAATTSGAAQILRIIDEKTPEGQVALIMGPKWDAQSFQGFWYDLDDGLSSETLKIVQTTLGDEKTAGKTRTLRDRSDAAGAGLIYETTRQLVQFEVYENKALMVENSLNAAGTKAAQGTHYGKLGWMGEEFIALSGKATKLSRLLIEQEEAASEKKTLTVGESWQIGDWTLAANAIDAKAEPRQVWLMLSYNGQKVDDKVITQGEVYTYTEKSIAGESDVPMFITYVDNVLAGATSDMVQLRFTWATSRDVIEIIAGDKIGIFEVVDAGEQKLTLENDASIDLSSNSVTTLAGNFVFKVADDADFLRFMPEVLITEPGTYEERGYVLDEKARAAELAAGFTWDAQSFKGFWYGLDDGLSSETLTITQTTLGDEKTAGRTRTIRDRSDAAGAGLIYETRRQLVEFEVNENRGKTVENALEAAGTRIAQGTHYGKLGWMGEEFVALSGNAKKISKLFIEQEDGAGEKKTLTVGESWQIGDWTLTANAIDAKAEPKQVWLTLSYNGQMVDDRVVIQGEVYTYIEKSIAGESDVPVFATYVDNVLAGATSDMVQLRFTWAISRDVIEIRAGDGIGIFEVVDAGEQKLRLENYASIVLSPDSTVTLAGNLNLKIADDADFLRFYPVVERSTQEEVTPLVTPAPTPADGFYNAIFLSGSMPGSVSQGSYVYYIFYAAFGEQVNITLSSSGTDQDIEVYDPYQNYLGSSDKYGIAGEVYSFTASTSGHYYAAVYGYEAGDYTISISGSATTPASSMNKTLQIGEFWDIGNGWILEIASIDTLAAPRQIWLTLYQHGVKIDDKILSEGQTYTYSGLPGTVYVEGIYAGATADVAQLGYGASPLNVTGTVVPALTATPTPAVTPTVIPTPASTPTSGAGGAIVSIVKMPDIITTQNSNVTSAIMVENVNNIAGATIWLTYDPYVVSVLSVSAGDLGTITAKIDSVAGRITMTAFNAKGISGNVTFANVLLKAVGSINATSVMTLSVLTLTDQNGTAIPYGKRSGTFTIASMIKGDVDGDAQVTVVDALFVAQYSVGLRTLASQQLSVADANCDGDINVVDALFIAQYTVGLRTSLCVASTLTPTITPTPTPTLTPTVAMLI